MAKNPFPGMNPYLERHWGDVHASLVGYASTQLNRQLPGLLRARIATRLLGSVEAGKGMIRVRERAVEDRGTGASTSRLCVASPDCIQLVEDEPETTTFVTIIDAAAGRATLTVVEFLTPHDKRPRGDEFADLYHARREQLSRDGVSLVEVDLLRAGERFFPAYASRYAKCLWSGYAACVRREPESQRYEVYSLALREKLPALRVPLRAGEQDVYLDLQPLIEQAYENGRYDDIDYASPLDPPLSAEDAEWAAGIVKVPASSAATGT